MTRRAKRYRASKRPDFNASEETWADYLKVDKSSIVAMDTLRAFLMRKRRPAATSHN